MSAPWSDEPRPPTGGRKRYKTEPDAGLGPLLARVLEWNKLNEQ